MEMELILALDRVLQTGAAPPPPGPTNAELREDGGYELREDGGIELRE